MGFQVAVHSGNAQVEPGSTAAVSVEITNTGDQVEDLELIVEGLDAEWTAVPVAAFKVEPGQVQVERYFLKPPRSPESTSGTYPYAVTVRSLETGEAKRIPGLLEVKPFHHLTIDFNPRRTAISYKSSSVLEVTAANLGNSEHRVQLFAADQDNVFGFEFDSDQAVLAPGQQKSASLSVSATQPSLLAGPRLSPFSVSVRSLDMPAVAGTAQGQAEQKALLSPAAFGVALALVLLVGLWAMFLPKTPRLDSLSAVPKTLLVGETATISWTSTDAESVRLWIGDDEPQTMPPDGQYSLTLDKAGPMEIRAAARRDDKESTVSFQRIEVENPPQAPLPVIERFEVTPRSIRLGEGILISYKLSSSVTQATLEPFTATLDTRATTFQVEPSVPGSTTVKLIARNADGKAVERSVSITVRDESMAKIVSFAASPLEFDPALGETVKLSWQLENAGRAELKYGGRVVALDALRGEMELVLSSTTTVRLTAYDTQGKAVTQSITVKAKEPPGPPDNQAAPPAPGTDPQGGPAAGAAGNP